MFFLYLKEINSQFKIIRLFLDIRSGLLNLNYKPLGDEVEGKRKLCNTGNIEGIYHFISISPLFAVSRKNMNQTTLEVQFHAVLCEK